MADLSEIAARATYVGSSEHKRFPNPLCNPALRSDASDCDAVDPTLSQDVERLTRILRETIRRGQIDRIFEGGFPRKGWGWLALSQGGEGMFEVRLTNATLGHYKGYFITLDYLKGKTAWVRAHLIEVDGDWKDVIR